MSNQQPRLPGMDPEPDGDSKPSNESPQAGELKSTPPTNEEPPTAANDKKNAPTKEAHAAKDKKNAPTEDPRAALPVQHATDAPKSLVGKTVYVIDTHSLIHQVYHALPEMTSPDGRPVNAIYGVARDLLGLRKSRKPDYWFCAVDLPGGTFRHQLFDQYKATRKPAAEDLVEQIPEVHRMINELGIPVVGVPSYEADDCMATIARQIEALGGECYLVTSDKDCRQLISDHVRMYNIRKNEIFDRASLEEAWGIRPDQVVDFQALVGDSADNVPGVPLIGPKLARELLEKYETLDGVLDHADEVSGKKRKQNLLEGRELALLSRKLVELDAHMDLSLDWESAVVGPIDTERIRPLFEQFGFRTLVTQLETINEPEGETAAAQSAAQLPLATSKGIEANYRLVETPEKFEKFLVELKKQKRFSFDTETTDISPRRAQLVGYSFAWCDDEAWYLPVRAPAGESQLNPDETLEALRPIFENPNVEKIGQNLKYDRIVLKAAGVEVAGPFFDTIVADYLLAAGSRSHSLDTLAERYFQHETIKIRDLIGTGKKQKRMDEVPIELVCDYAAEDALIPWLLRPILAGQLQQNDLESLFEEVEIPLTGVLAEMEYLGVRVDAPRLAKMSKRFGQRMERLEEECFALAGHPFNLASPKQLQEVLFEELGLPVVKKTKTGPSTDADVLSKLAPLHALPAKIVEYRQAAKLKNTYVDALPKLIYPKTGRVHTSFNQVVTATGRLSSSDPNLQNIPVRTEEGREIRSAFVPGTKGEVLLAADYSQIELRVLAHFSQDAQLVKAFQKDEDIHTMVAGQINNVELDEVTSEMRRQAKAVNFGVIYGQSAFGLSAQLGIPREEAQAFIDAYFAKYPGIVDFLEKVLDNALETGYVKTVLGRRRAVEGIRRSRPKQRSLGERMAINTVIQGSAADLIKLAMLGVGRRLEEEAFPAKLLLQIHDELIFEVPATHLNELARLVTEEMVRAYSLCVPLRVSVKAGPSWAEAESLEVGSDTDFPQNPPV